MAPELYFPTFLAGLTVLVLLEVFQYSNSPNYALQEKKENVLFPVLICLVLTFWLGFRNTYSYKFGDTVSYRRIYDFVSPVLNWNIFASEGLWTFLMSVFKTLGLKVSWFFTFVEFFYLFTVLWAVKLFFPNKPYIGFLFVLSSLMFYTFGVNGIRNGLACHIILLAIAYFFSDKYLLGAFLVFVAFGIHRSTIIPIAALPVALWVIKKPQYAIYIWLFSILFSLAFETAAINFFTSLGFDDRMAQYGSTELEKEAFSFTGFRWDFLLYSSLPIILMWYVSIRRNIQDNWYNALCVIYCLSNAVWILVIRAAFSNRFAYLSWFLYPIVIAYPLLCMPVWKDQDRRIGYALISYLAFTLFMNVIVWGG